MWKDFKAFIARGSVLDLAIGIIIGGAFGQVISTLVTHVLMPPIGLLLGRVDFSSLYINLTRHRYASLAKAKAAGAPTIDYGLFINSVIDFLIVALVIFIVIRWLSRLHAPKSVPVATKNCPYCITVIALHATRCPNCTSELKA